MTGYSTIDVQYVYLLDFMSDFVYIDAAVICFLLIITVPTLKK